MKKLIFKISFLIIFFSATQLFAQWQADVRLTNDPANSRTSYNNAWCITASGNTLHVVWYDFRDGNNEIYYKRSTDSGVNWGADTRLTVNTADSWLPSVAVSGSVVHVVWYDERDGNYEIYYKRSTDSGLSWGTDTRLTNNTAASLYPSVAVSGSVVHVVWHDSRDGNEEIYYKRSTDSGLSWGADTRLTNNTVASLSPSVAVSGSVVHLVWYDSRDGNWEIYYKRSTDGGVSWGTDIRLTNNTAASWYPSVAVSGSVVHVVWYDERDGNLEIYYKRSTDSGVNWGADTRLTNNTSYSESPSVAVSGSVVHVVWYDYRDGNYEIYYKRSTDSGVNWGADTRLTNNTAYSVYPSVAVSGSALHVVWFDERDGNSEIYYKRSTDSGVNWGTDTRLTNNTALSEYPSVTVSGSVLHVVWHDYRDGNWEIYYKRSTDGGVSWGTDIRLTNNTAISEYPSVTVSGSVLHVVWTDNRDGNWEIYYKRDPTGNPVGIININSEIPGEFSLSQNYPNPFNPKTSFQFSVPSSSFVKVLIYDALGREVDILINSKLEAGEYLAEWNANNFASGIYIYKIEALDNKGNKFVETKKMVLVK